MSANALPKNSSKNYYEKSFKGKDLTGLDLSHANISGADFEDAILIGVDFSHAKTGISKKWRVIHRCLLIVFTALSAFFATFASVWIGGYTDLVDSLAGGLSVTAFTLFIFLGFISITLLRGVGAELWIFAIITVTAVGVILVLPPTSSRVFALISILLLDVLIASTLIGAIAVSMAHILFCRWLSVDRICAAIGASILGAYVGTTDLVGKPAMMWALAFMVPVSLILLALVLYLGSSAANGDARYRLIHRIAVAISFKGATSFKHADLTGANFHGARLKHADMREAKLTRTSFNQVHDLDKARVEGTYLTNPRIRELLVSRHGPGMHLRGLNLQGLNLSHADLSAADLKGAKLIGTDLRSANLSKANLTQAQLYGADLTGAQMTGATIEDWAISTDSIFEKVECDYIYMRLRTEDDLDPWRKPDNRNEIFQPGDFKDFVAPIFKALNLYRQQFVDPRQVEITLKSLDLYHHGGVDPTAAAVALKQLAEQHPNSGLKITALEGQGDEKIRLQTQVIGKADRSQLSAEYTTKYREAAALPHDDLQSLLSAMAEKDKHIQSLESMVTTAMKSDKFYVETYYDLGKPNEVEQPPVKKILILTANPTQANRTRLDEEVREIQAGLERAKKREQFEIIAKWAVRPEDLRRALLDNEPHIVQFSGAGIESQGLALENGAGDIQLVPAAALARLFSMFNDRVECVFLNACYSAEQTHAISQHIPYVIGMKQEIGDRAALTFALGFYDALGAGRSIEDAFSLGCISLNLEGLPDSLTPILKKKNGFVV